MRSITLLAFLAFSTLIPYLYSAEHIIDVQLFETVSEGGVLSAQEQKRAEEMYEAWRRSETTPSAAEHPKLGDILEQMATLGMVESEADRAVAAEVADDARRAIVAHSSDGEGGTGSGAADGGAPWWQTPWVRDFGMILILAFAIVAGGVVLAQVQRRIRSAGRR